MNQHKGVKKRSKYVTRVQQQRPESPTVTLTWHACKYKVHKLHQRYMLNFMYLVYTRMPGESYRSKNLKQNEAQSARTESTHKGVN